MENINQPLNAKLSEVYTTFMNTLDRFSEKQINEVPYKDSWTPGQVANHIVKATKDIPDKYTVAADRPHDEKVKKIESVFLDFDAKFKSPEFVVPDNGPFNKFELLQTLRGIQEKNTAKINNTDLTEVCLKFELPGIGTMTRYEWYRFIIAHIIRHTFQLNKILTAMAAQETA